MSGRRNLMIAQASINPLSIPLTLTAETASSTVKIRAVQTPTVSGLQCRRGTSGEWLPYTIDTTITLSAVGDSVQFQNTENTLSASNTTYAYFAMTGKIAASGNVMSMLNWRMDCPNYGLLNLFSNCASLAAPPELPATSVGNYGYYNMFGKSDITTAPKLPATTLGTYAYSYMFTGCASLVTPPDELPEATAMSCYAWMFAGCSSLIRAPKIKATTLATQCMRYMFSGCTSLGEIDVDFTQWGYSQAWVTSVPEGGTFYKPAALPETFGADNIPTGWTVINK